MSKKIVGILIIGLFIGTSNIPSICGNIENYFIDFDNVNSTFLDPPDDQLDQYLTERDFVLATLIPFAQSFRPTCKTLTRFFLRICSQPNYSSNELIVSIRSSLNGEDIRSIRIDDSDLPDDHLTDWIEFDIEDMNVIPEEEYFIVVTPIDFKYVVEYNRNEDLYTRGDAWEYYMDEWVLGHGRFDFLFKTYGKIPSANSGGPYFGNPGESIFFKGNAYGGTPPYSFEWNFGDGIGTSTLQNPTYAYTTEGVYTVTLTVTDDENLIASDNTTSTISVGSADLECSGSISWEEVKPGGIVSDSFTVENVGANGTFLDWEVTENPNWGIWTLNPSSGDGLIPENGKVTVEVSVIAPEEKNREFSGEIKVVNKDDSNDYSIIPISLSTPKSKLINITLILQRLFQRFPLFEKILNQII